jgi:two-component system, response regulator PdtaR
MLRILVVEDEPLIAMDIEMSLEQAGYTVVGVARDMHEAISIASASDVDLALMDINLANGTNGFDTACTLNAEHSIRSIFISAELFTDARARAEECGAAGYLNKPFSDDQLIEAVRSAPTN